MLLLKHNTLEFEDLIRIERQYLRWLKSDQSLVTSDFNVLDYSHIDLYGHLLGMFDRLNILNTLNITASQFLDFLIDLDQLYLDTPYHSFYHAVDIVTVLYFTMTELDAGIYFEEKEVAILFLAAVCHDVGHPGYNNDFQTRTQSQLGLCYKESVLESYSIDLSLSLVRKHNLFSVDSVSLFKRLILSTDMTHHFKLLEKARHGIDLAEILLHAADISNTVRAWPICKQWSDLIVQEFFRQGDAERLHGLSVSPGMDRYLTSQANISLRFGDFIVRPYFEAIQRWFPKTSLWITHLDQNKIRWENEPLLSNRHLSVNIPAGALRLPSLRRIARASSHSNIFTSPSQSELRRNSVQPILS
ncbi:hypothetical protein BY458DRAFT_524708 [Sporodiniella umbellata]|nr:hypothetical protein BY458DRAFT_524708 [Sporodiniella umbellata]